MLFTDSLLATLYRAPAPLRHILADDAGPRFNVPLASATDREKQDALVDALRRGWVEVHPLANRRPTRSNIVQALMSDRLEGASLDVVLGLTRRGGAAWERKARPEWGLFLIDMAPRVLKGRVWVCFEGRDRKWLSSVQQTLARLGFFLRNESRIVVRRNWRPVYWKRFQVGYALEIDTGYTSDDERGKKYLDDGMPIANERLATTVSLLSAIWDARWITYMQASR